MIKPNPAHIAYAKEKLETYYNVVERVGKSHSSTKSIKEHVVSYDGSMRKALAMEKLGQLSEERVTLANMPHWVEIAFPWSVVEATGLHGMSVPVPELLVFLSGCVDPGLGKYLAGLAGRLGASNGNPPAVDNRLPFYERQLSSNLVLMTVAENFPDFIDRSMHIHIAMKVRDSIYALKHGPQNAALYIPYPTDYPIGAPSKRQPDGLSVPIGLALYWAHAHTDLYLDIAPALRMAMTNYPDRELEVEVEICNRGKLDIRDLENAL